MFSSYPVCLCRTDCLSGYAFMLWVPLCFNRRVPWVLSQILCATDGSPMTLTWGLFCEFFCYFSCFSCFPCHGAAGRTSPSMLLFVCAFCANINQKYGFMIVLKNKHWLSKTYESYFGAGESFCMHLTLFVFTKLISNSSVSKTGFSTKRISSRIWSLTTTPS